MKHSLLHRPCDFSSCHLTSLGTLGASAIFSLLVACAALLAPGSAAAAKPAVASCAVLVPEQIYVNQPFTAKVVRVPRYPGGWSQPVIQIDVAYPTTPGNEFIQSMEQKIWRHNVTYTTATFLVPDTTEGIVVNEDANITAVVREPISRKRFKETLCAATTTVLP